MRTIILFLVFLSFACKKEKDQIKPSEPQGQIYFWNPYPISSIGDGIDIVIDDTVRIHNFRLQSLSNGFYFKTKVGIHKWFYACSTTYLNANNYGKHGETNVQENKTDTIKMIR